MLLAMVSFLLAYFNFITYFPVFFLLRMVDLALAVDVTARNLQDQARRAGLPWAAAKGFDTFTPVG